MPRNDFEEIDRNVGRKIQEARLSFGHSREKLASYVKVTQQQISKYENGQNRISATKLFKIARFYNLPLEFFFEEHANSIENKVILMRIMRQVSALDSKKKSALNEFLKVNR